MVPTVEKSVNSAYAYYLQMGSPLPDHLGSYKAINQSILKELNIHWKDCC